MSAIIEGNNFQTKGLRRRLSLRETSRVPTCGAKRSLTRLPGQLLFARTVPMGKPESLGLNGLLGYPCQQQLIPNIDERIVVTGNCIRVDQIPSTDMFHNEDEFCKNPWITSQSIAAAIMYHCLFQDNPANWRSLLSTEFAFLLKILAWSVCTKRARIFHTSRKLCKLHPRMKF